MKFDTENLQNKYIIFYDDDCGFCNYWVQWILEKDKNHSFLYSSLQSNFGQSFLKERGLNATDFDTIILWKPKGYYLTKSAAIFKILNLLKGKYSLLAYFRFLPTTITNWSYEMVAKRRKNIKTNSCRLLTPAEKEKFIE